MKPAGSHKLDARTAELIARQLNSAYMNACGFGVDHPTTERALETFCSRISTALEHDKTLSVILDRGSLFVEKHPVGARFNPKRMIDSFNEIGLESITFSPGFGPTDARALVAVLAKLLDYPSLEVAEADLNARQSGSIRFNYIVYRKVTSDQKVVTSGAPGEDPGESVKSRKPDMPESGGSARILGQLDSLFSLGGIAGNPGAAAERIGSYLGDEDGARSRLVDHLKRLVHEIETGGGNIEGLSPNELFTAMNTLRQRLQRTVGEQQDVGRIMAEGGDVVSEVDELTYSTLVSLVREEYRGGNFSVQRMAQIINRMLPDASDLKRLLPRLHRGLIEEGMPLDQYKALVHELSNELRGEHLVRALETGAENVGMSVDDIVQQIRDDPTEAARLVVLSNELRHGGVGDKQQLSAAFTDYIERISQELALDRVAPGEPVDPGSLGEQIERIQKELIDQMNRGGLAPEASRQLEDQLRQRMPEVRERSKMALFERMLDSSEQLSDTLILDWLEQQLESRDELQQLSEAISQRLEARGYTPEQAAGLLERLAGRMETESRPPPLPASVLSVANTALFLKHEVQAAQRYGNPFSAVKLLVEWLVPVQGGAPQRPRRSDIGQLLPELYFRILRLARDLDLVGSLEKTQRAVPFIILPMTEEEGARIFRRRLLDVLAEFPFRLDSGEYTLTCTVTAASFDSQADTDANTFVQRLNQAHQASRAATAHQAAQRTASAQSGR